MSPSSWTIGNRRPGFTGTSWEWRKSLEVVTPRMRRVWPDRTCREVWREPQAVWIIPGSALASPSQASCRAFAPAWPERKRRSPFLRAVGEALRTNSRRRRSRSTGPQEQTLLTAVHYLKRSMGAALLGRFFDWLLLRPAIPLHGRDDAWGVQSLRDPIPKQKRCLMFKAKQPRPDLLTDRTFTTSEVSRIAQVSLRQYCV